MRNFTICFMFFFAFAITGTGGAQIAISKPILGFSQACASPSFNEYYITFSFSPESGFEASNQFIIELSDATGSFSNATIVYTSSAGSITTSPTTLGFSFPATLAGESYKLRVKSTAPAATSSSSNAFAGYYKLQDTPFTINNLIASGVYCSGGSYLLTIDNPGGPSNDSPLQYPPLKFRWYKETGATTSEFIAEGESLLVSDSGTYFVETNYGSCTSSSYSNRVTVSESGSGVSSSNINSSLGNPFCASKGATTLSAISGIGYQWYKDGNEIPGANDQMYVTDQSGTYDVVVDLGNCSETASIDLNGEGFESSIDVAETNVMGEGESIVATVTTDAVNPIFQWYRDGILISEATDSSYEVTQTGDFNVVVSQTDGCLASSDFLFSITSPVEQFPDVLRIPNLISPNGDGINDTWVIPQKYVSGTNTEVTILSSQGKVVFQTNDYQNNWPENQLGFKDVNPIYFYIIKMQDQNTRQGSITVVK